MTTAPNPDRIDGPDAAPQGSTPPTPPVLYLPLHRTSTATEPRVEIRRLRDGRQALLVYSALDRLLDLCGANQRWILVRTEDLAQLKARQPFDVVISDLAVPEQYRSEGAIA